MGEQEAVPAARRIRVLAELAGRGPGQLSPPADARVTGGPWSLLRRQMKRSKPKASSTLVKWAVSSSGSRYLDASRMKLQASACANSNLATM